MAISDDTSEGRARRMKLVLTVALAVLVGAGVTVGFLVGFGYWSIWKFQDHAQAEEIDIVEETFFDNRAGFEGATEFVVELAQSEPRAMAVRWNYGLVCFIDAAGEQTCRDTTPREEEASDQTPRVRRTIWQEKDDGRVFFGFNEHTCYLMFDPQQRDAKHFATERGFSWERDLGEGWSIPCHISNVEDRDAMWVGDST